MLRKSRGVRQALTLLLMTTVVGWCLPTIAADAVPTERRLGNDVIAYLSIRSLNDFKTAVGQSALGKLAQDPEMAEFIAQIGPLWEQLAQGFESETNLKLADVLAIPQGEFAIAVVHSAGKPMGVIATLDFGDHRETVDLILTKANEEYTKDSEHTQRSEEEVDGTTIVTYTFTAINEDEDDSENEKSKKAPPFTLNYCIKDSTLVISSRPDSLKSVLQRWDGQQERTFAEKAVYKYIKERCRGDNADEASLVTFYVDPIGIFKGALALGGADASTSAMALGFLPSLGIDKFKAIGGTVDMGTEQFDSISRFMIYIDQPTSGVMNIFKFPATELAPPKWVAADVASFAMLNWDLDGAYTAVEGLYDTFLGAGALGQALDELAEQEDGPKIHLKTDIIDQLTGNFLFVSGVDEEEADLGNPLAGVNKLVIGLQVKDEAAFGKNLQKLADLPGFPGQVREFEGAKVIQMGDEAAGLPVTPAVSVAKGYLLFVVNVEALEDILRSNDDRQSLTDDPQYQRVAKIFPEQASMIGFQRADAQLKTLYTALKSGALTEAVDDEVPLDLSKLPEFEVIQKYLAPTGSFMVPDERGWFSTSFSLKASAE